MSEKAFSNVKFLDDIVAEREIYYPKKWQEMKKRGSSLEKKENKGE